VQADEDGPPAKRRRSIIINHVKKEHYTQLDKISKHCQNALVRDTDLTNEIDTARDFEQVAFELVETAKARVTSIGRMWEAKMQRDEALRAQKMYGDLERKMRDLEDEMATSCDELYVKSQVVDEWESIPRMKSRRAF
jgi:hypothetical protein